MIQCVEDVLKCKLCVIYGFHLSKSKTPLRESCLNRCLNTQTPGRSSGDDSVAFSFLLTVLKHKLTRLHILHFIYLFHMQIKGVKLNICFNFLQILHGSCVRFRSHTQTETVCSDRLIATFLFSTFCAAFMWTLPYLWLTPRCLICLIIDVKDISRDPLSETTATWVSEAKMSFEWQKRTVLRISLMLRGPAG